MALRIDLMTTADVPALMAMEPVVFPGEEWPAAEYHRALSSPSWSCLALRNGDAVVGGGIVTPTALRAAEIRSIGIHPSHQRRGLGMALLLTEMALAVRGGAHQADLQVSTAKDRTIALYERFGFRHRGRATNFYGSGRDAFRMRADLTSEEVAAALASARARVATLGIEFGDQLSPLEQPPAQ